MISRARCGRPRFDHWGFGLVEWALVLSVVAVSIAVLTGSTVQHMDTARAVRTLTDMSAILDAGQKYRAVNGMWPGNIKEVSAFLSKVQAGNAWGNGYLLSHDELRLWVESDVPKGAVVPLGRWPAVFSYPSGGNTRWRMAAPLSYGATARLIYEKE